MAFEAKQDALRETLKTRIASGVYAEKLPGMQSLAREFGVNVKTINKVIRALVAEGVLDNRGARGTFVSSGPQGPVTVTSPWTDVEREVFARAAGEFTSSTGGEVAWGDERPDVVKVNAAGMAVLAERLVPLDGLMPKLFMKRFLPAAAERFRYSGRQYGLPMTVSPYLIYYSVEHLARLGLSRPGPFASLDEFAGLCERLVRKAGAKYAFAAHERFTYMLPFLWQTETELVEPDALRSRLQAPEVEAAFAFYAGLHGTSVPDAGEQDWRPALDAFLAGDLAMMGWGGWMERWLARERPGRFGVAALQIAGRTDTLLFSEGFAIAKDSPRPAAAWSFLEALFSPKAQEAFMLSGVQIPAVREGAPPAPGIFAEMLPSAHPGGMRMPAEVIDLLTAEWKGFLRGEEPYSRFARRVSPALDVLLAHIARERDWRERALAEGAAGADPRHPAPAGGRAP